MLLLWLNLQVRTYLTSMLCHFNARTCQCLKPGYSSTVILAFGVPHSCWFPKWSGQQNCLLFWQSEYPPQTAPGFPCHSHSITLYFCTNLGCVVFMALGYIFSGFTFSLFMFVVCIYLKCVLVNMVNSHKRFYGDIFLLAYLGMLFGKVWLYSSFLIRWMY